MIAQALINFPDHEERGGHLAICLDHIGDRDNSGYGIIRAADKYKLLFA